MDYINELQVCYDRVLIVLSIKAHTENNALK
jgi:hypothetical protein